MCKKLANLLYRSSCCLVLDDEKYFTYDGSNMQGNDNYYSNDKSKCPDSVRFAGKEKYPNRLPRTSMEEIMAWIYHYWIWLPKPLLFWIFLFSSKVNTIWTFRFVIRVVVVVCLHVGAITSSKIFLIVLNEAT